MSERYDHPTGQLRLRPRSSRRNNLLVGAGTAAVLVLLVLNVLVWSSWSGSSVTPVSATHSPPASASPVPAESPVPPEPTASPTPANPGQGGGAEPAEPEHPEDPEDPAELPEPEATVVVIDPSVVLPSIGLAVTEVVPGACLEDSTAAGAIEVTALDIWYPMTVEYRWLRSGEFIGPTQSVQVDGNTTIPVSTQWQATEAAGWVSLEVTGAFDAVSEQVEVASCLS